MVYICVVWYYGSVALFVGIGVVLYSDIVVLWNYQCGIVIVWHSAVVVLLVRYCGIVSLEVLLW